MPGRQPIAGLLDLPGQDAGAFRLEALESDAWAVAMTFAGVPATVALSGTDLFTMLHAPTTEFSPMTKPSSWRAIKELFMPI